ncbi:hypothetical protein LAHI110946_00535 [Lactococcus hircilactis]
MKNKKLSIVLVMVAVSVLIAAQPLYAFIMG